MGVWTHLGGREFTLTFHAFVFDEAGHFDTVSQVRVQSVLDEGLDNYTGQFQSTRSTRMAMPSVSIVAAWSPPPASSWPGSSRSTSALRAERSGTLHAHPDDARPTAAGGHLRRTVHAGS